MTHGISQYSGSGHLQASLACGISLSLLHYLRVESAMAPNTVGVFIPERTLAWTFAYG